MVEGNLDPDLPEDFAHIVKAAPGDPPPVLPDTPWTYVPAPRPSTPRRSSTGTRRNTNTRGNTEEDAAKGAQRNTNTRGDSKEDTTKGARRNTTATAS